MQFYGFGFEVSGERVWYPSSKKRFFFTGASVRALFRCTPLSALAFRTCVCERDSARETEFDKERE